MRAVEAEGLAAIDAEFEEPVTYTGAGLVGAVIGAIRSEGESQSFDGPGSTLREVCYEVRQSLLPAEPRKGNVVADDTGTWKVNDITRRNDIGKYMLIVVRA